jgi:hypothetical protein
MMGREILDYLGDISFGSIDEDENDVIEITLNPSEPVAGVSFNISFNPSLLMANAVSEGDLFESYNTYFNPGIIINTNGPISGVYGVITTPGGSTISPGVFAEIQFTAKTLDGISPLTLSSVVVGIPGGTPVSIAIYHGNITVIAYLTDDVNMDGQVNILDLVLIAKYWEQTGNPGCIRADVNKDGVVDILDMIIIGQHWTG